MSKPTAIYATDAKKTARNFLIRHTRGVVITRALTMPSRDATCAKVFKKKFNCHVTGIDLSEQLICTADDPSVDEFYQGNAFDLADLSSLYRIGVWTNCPSGESRNLSRKQHLILPSFDLMFLDFVSVISKDRIKLIGKIIDNYASPKAVVGVTLMRPKDDTMLISEEKRLLKMLCPTGWKQHTHRYFNTNPKRGTISNMLLTVLVNR